MDSFKVLALLLSLTAVLLNTDARPHPEPYRSFPYPYNSQVGGSFGGRFGEAYGPAWTPGADNSYIIEYGPTASGGINHGYSGFGGRSGGYDSRERFEADNNGHHGFSYRANGFGGENYGAGNTVGLAASPGNVYGGLNAPGQSAGIGGQGVAGVGISSAAGTIPVNKLLVDEVANEPPAGVGFQGTVGIGNGGVEEPATVVGNTGISGTAQLGQGLGIGGESGISSGGEGPTGVNGDVNIGGATAEVAASGGISGTEYKGEVATGVEPTTDQPAGFSGSIGVVQEGGPGIGGGLDVAPAENEESSGGQSITSQPAFSASASLGQESGTEGGLNAFTEAEGALPTPGDAQNSVGLGGGAAESSTDNTEQGIGIGDSLNSNAEIDVASRFSENSATGTASQSGIEAGITTSTGPAAQLAGPAGVVQGGSAGIGSGGTSSTLTATGQTTGFGFGYGPGAGVGKGFGGSIGFGTPPRAGFGTASNFGLRGSVTGIGK